MPRGNYWEVTFDPEWSGPTEDAALTDLAGSSGLVRRRVVAPTDKPVSVMWKKGDPIRRHFQECDFVLRVEQAYISNCTFTRCRFKGSTWDRVKFSGCTFECCDFSGVTIRECYFLADCRFVRNSASGELFRVEETAVSASAFLSALVTNLDHLPATTTRVYQASRFVGTRLKIAKVLFSATRNEADLEYFYEAYEQLVRCSLDQQIERHRFDPEGVKDSPPALRQRWWFLGRTLPARGERGIVLLSGWLSDWGRSLFRASLFFAVVVVAFALAYLARDAGLPAPSLGRRAVAALLEAMDISLVAGYTAHVVPAAALGTKILWFGNLVCGLFWYSLVIPVLSRRILR